MRETKSGLFLFLPFPRLNPIIPPASACFHLGGDGRGKSAINSLPPQYRGERVNPTNPRTLASSPISNSQPTDVNYRTTEKTLWMERRIPNFLPDPPPLSTSLSLHPWGHVALHCKGNGGARSRIWLIFA